MILKKKIYIELPLGFKSKEGMACKLKEALYGLKQSSRTWFKRFIDVKIRLGYKQSQEEHTMFVRHSKIGGATVLLVYMNDILL